MIRCETNLHFLNISKGEFYYSLNGAEKASHHFQELLLGDAKKARCLFEFNLHNHMRWNFGSRPTRHSGGHFSLFSFPKLLIN